MKRAFAFRTSCFAALLTIACSPAASPPSGGSSGSGGTAGTNAPGGATGGASGSSGSGGNVSPGTGGSNASGGTGGTGGTVAGGTGGTPGTPDGGGVGDTAPAGNDGGANPGSSMLPGLSAEGDGDRMIGPNYTVDPMTMAGNAPKGKRFNFMMMSSESTIYKGVRGAYSRRVSVYIPAEYVPGTAAPFMVTQDGMGQDVLPNLLDNLIAAKKLPKLVIFFADSGGGDAVGSQRGLEYDTVSGLFAEYVDKEMLPRGITEAKAQLNIDLKLTTDPDGRGTLGGSSGGAGSFSMAWWRPDLFRRVLAYSGTFVNQVPANSPFPHGAWVYHDVDPYGAAPNGLIVQHCEPAGGFKGVSNPTPCDTPLSQTACEAAAGCQWNTKVNRPLRIWHQSSDRDLESNTSPQSYRNFHLANQRMAAAFKARGYHYHYDNASNAVHVDQKVVRQTIGEAMLWLWRGYPIE